MYRNFNGSEMITKVCFSSEIGAKFSPLLLQK